MTIGAGTRLGPYEIVAPLGAGGMGEVYLASDARLGRRVALKVLPAGAADDPGPRKRLLREARAAASLDHPNVCSVYELGEEGGQLFIAMAYVEGETLAQRLARGPVPAPEALRVASQVVEALAEAHSKGIVHRDLKPSNVMVTLRGQVKVLDFGIATAPSLAESRAATEDALTATGAAIGSVPYMSPEQARGETVDERSDVFSFGTLLYELLAGRRPFEGPTAAAILGAVLAQDPAPLGARVTALPKGVESLVRRCLEKDRKDRFASARELASALAAATPIQSGEGRDRAPSGDGPSRSLIHRRRALRNGGIAATLVAIGFGAFLFVRGRSRGLSAPGDGGASVKALAVLPLANLSGDPKQDYFADGMTEELTDRLAQLGGLRVISRTSIMSLKGTRKSVPEIGRDLDIDAVIEGSVLRAEDQVRISVQLIAARTEEHLWGRSYVRPLKDILALQDEVGRAIASEVGATIRAGGAQSAARVASIDPAAFDSYLKGLDLVARGSGRAPEPEGLALLKEAVVRLDGTVAAEPGFAPAWAALATAHHWIASSYPPETASWAKGRAAAETSIRLDPSLDEGHGALGFILFGGYGDGEAAEQEFRRAIELNPNSPHRHGFAIFLSDRGRHEEAISQIRLAQAANPLSLAVRIGAGSIYIEARRFEEAVAAYRQAIEMAPGNLPALDGLGEALVLSGARSEGIAVLRRVVSIPEGSDFVADLAWALAITGNRTEAEGLLEKLDRGPKNEGEDVYVLAIVNAALGRADRALELLEVAFEKTPALRYQAAVDVRLDRVRPDARFQALVPAPSLSGRR
jgi:eukaryotic-like serine/threonine-protein kinase